MNVGYGPVIPGVAAMVASVSAAAQTAPVASYEHTVCPQSLPA